MKKTDQIVLLDILKLSKERYSSRQIAELTGCSKTTACQVLQKAKELGIDFDKAVEIGTNKLFQAMYPPRDLRPLDEAIYEKFLKFENDKRLTRMALWEEYIKENPDGVKYGQFCNIFKKFGVPVRKMVYINEKRFSSVV
jgi:biotin operon repressor